MNEGGGFTPDDRQMIDLELSISFLTEAAHEKRIQDSLCLVVTVGDLIG